MSWRSGESGWGLEFRMQQVFMPVWEVGRLVSTYLNIFYLDNGQREINKYEKGQNEKRNNERFPK